MKSRAQNFHLSLRQTKISHSTLYYIYVEIKTNLIYLCIGQTSLMYAARYGESDAVKILLDHGADIKDKDNTG